MFAKVLLIWNWTDGVNLGRRFGLLSPCLKKLMDNILRISRRLGLQLS